MFTPVERRIILHHNTGQTLPGRGKIRGMLSCAWIEGQLRCGATARACCPPPIADDTNHGALSFRSISTAPRFLGLSASDF